MSLNVFLDLSRQKVEVISEELLKMCNLRMLYLEGNSLRTLPDSFFRDMNRLKWLDLRGNKLEEIPASIAYHPCLETLLIQDNYLTKLPNELGLVPNLKRLQLSGNPLTYPPNYVLENGTRFILEFLKETFIKISNENAENTAEDLQNGNGEGQNTAENGHRVNGESTTDMVSKTSFSSTNYTPSVSMKRLVNKRSKEFVTCGLRRRPNRLIATCPKLITVKPFHNSNKYIRANKKMNKAKMDLKVETRELRDMWMRNLRELINQQNAILQKEKNLNALRNWQQGEKTLSQYKSIGTATENYKLEYPFGIDPEYMSILANLNVEKDVKRLLSRGGKKPAKKVDMMRIISDIVKQLKSLETAPNFERSPRTEVEIANREIIKILEIQKKIDELKIKNDVM